ncbi:MAG: 3' terminal RNA ribose 2'-O-methyltransferase Hen1, partial [Bacteroidota bacterium]
MLLNITASATHKHPATDLGYLLGKHPERWQQKPLSFGTAHVFYPKISPECCTATLLLDIDTTREMRNRRLDHQGRNANVQAGFDQYVTDRAYVAGSLLASAVAKVFGGAMNGKCPQRPELVEAVWPLEIELAAVSVRGSADLLHEVFEPLGYQLSYQQVPLDERFPSWGDSPYYHLRLRNTCTLQRAVQHLYVLLPILDNRKHYFVKEAEVEKLLAKAKDWLATHPKREFITRRYLRHRRNLQRDALAELDATTPPTATEKSSEAILARKTPLHEQRH